jgi:hypothetical protein
MVTLNDLHGLAGAPFHDGTCIEAKNNRDVDIGPEPEKIRRRIETLCEAGVCDT